MYLIAIRGVHYCLANLYTKMRKVVPFVGLPCLWVLSGRNTSRCEDNNPSSEDCSKYNSLASRLFDSTNRRRNCTATLNCTFSGNQLFGRCDSLSQVDLSRLKERELHNFLTFETTHPDNDPEPVRKARVIINEQLASSAADSIKESQETANEMAKLFLLELFSDKENSAKLGVFLGDLFTHETVLHPTRELLFWSIATDHSMRNTEAYCQYLRDYWLRDEGSPATTKNIVDLGEWWLLHPLSRIDIVTPLITWTLEQPEMTIEPLAKRIVESSKEPYVKARWDDLNDLNAFIVDLTLSDFQKLTAELLSNAVAESLKSDDAR